ncbi:MAG TPA: adenylate/guanylate cyclase domain-containing protein [Chloroflexota bacterium]|nr:adenylate/guanylate cyclase domain-containing protein [Chloroflexota bacterium]
MPPAHHRSLMNVRPEDLDRPLPSFWTLIRHQRQLGILANLVGGLLTFFYVAAIDPIPTGNRAVQAISFWQPVEIAALVAVGFAVFELGSLRTIFRAAAWAKYHEPGAEAPISVQRYVINKAPRAAWQTFAVWVLAGILFGATPHFEAANRIHLFLDVAAVGGIVTTAIVYYGTDLVWAAAIRMFFPAGNVSAAPGIQRTVLVKLMSTFMLVGIAPPALLAYLALSRSQALLGAANPTAILANLHIVVTFVLVVSLLSSWILAQLVTRSIVGPLRELRLAMSLVRQHELNIHAPVSSRDELGYLAEGFNHMVADLRDREVVRAMFGQYVTNQVAEAVLAGQVKLGGERKDVTVLITDIRSFTTLSESRPPEQVMAMLNDYFSRMIDAIVEFDGTLDKFVGDAIVVEFNMPLPAARHPLRAVLTALRMRDNLVEFNRGQVAAGLPAIRIGMGIHTGMAVVGNLGAEGKKLEYTAIGDTVNVAARLEDLTKELAADICLSQDVYDAVARWVEVTPPITTTVKGRNAPVTVYRLLDLKQGLRLGVELLEADDPSAQPSASTEVRPS